MFSHNKHLQTQNSERAKRKREFSLNVFLPVSKPMNAEPDASVYFT